MTDPEELRVRANGLRFGALGWGPADGPLALLVHGYPDTAWTWRHLGPHLAERGWRVVAPFTRGYAPTDLAPDDSYLASQQAMDLLALHAALGGGPDALLVGHDWGAVATYAVAAADTTRFGRHVTLAVPPTPTLLRPFRAWSTRRLALRQARMSWYMAWNQLPGAERTLGRLVPAHWRAWSPGYDSTLDVERVLAALPTAEHRRAALRYYRDNLQGGIVEGFRTRPAAPVMYLHGEDDGCMQADLLTAFPDELPQGSRFERLPGVGHFLHLEDPARVHALVDEWAPGPGRARMGR